MKEEAKDLEVGVGKGVVIPVGGEDVQVFSMLQKAVEKGQDVQTLERLLDLRERIYKEKAKQEFYQALSALQAELPEIKPDKKVMNKDGTLRFAYASLDNIIKTIQPLLLKYGFSYHFKQSFNGDIVTVTCVVTHASGWQEETSFSCKIDTSMHMSPIQQIGASLTYAKRYSLIAAFGITTSEDEESVFDANIQPAGQPAGEPQQTSQPQQDNGITQAQTKLLFDLLPKVWTKEQRLEFAHKIIGREISSYKELTKKEASMLIDALKNAEKEPF